MRKEKILILSVINNKKIEEIRKELCLFSHSFAALQFPTHITLRKPVKINENKEKESIENFKKLMKNFSQFEIETEDILTKTYEEKGKTKYTARYTIKKNENLTELHNLLNSYDKKPKEDFKAHLTLVFGDLTPTNYKKLTKYIEKNKEKFPLPKLRVDNITLFKRIKNKWKELYRFNLK